MSHELRTPLNAVIGYSEMLLEDAEAERREEQQIGDLRRINGAGKHLLSLVTDVLDLSKIEAGKMELAAEPFDSAACIDDVVATCRPLVVENGNELVIERERRSSAPSWRSDQAAPGGAQPAEQRRQVHQQGRVSLAAARERAARGRAAGSASRCATPASASARALPGCSRISARSKARRRASSGGTGLGLALSQKLCRHDGRRDHRREPARPAPASPCGFRPRRDRRERRTRRSRCRAWRPPRAEDGGGERRHGSRLGRVLITDLSVEAGAPVVAHGGL